MLDERIRNEQVDDLAEAMLAIQNREEAYLFLSLIHI